MIKAVQHCSDYWWYITELLIRIPDLSTVASLLTQLQHWSVLFKENSQSERPKYLLCPMFIHLYLKYINSDVAEKNMSSLPCFWIEKILNKHGKWLIYLHQLVKRFYFNYSKNKIKNSQLFSKFLKFWKKIVRFTCERNTIFFTVRKVLNHDWLNVQLSI